MVAVYGGAGFLPETMPYEMYVGLWLNLPRVRLQRAMDVKKGFVLAHTRKELPTAVYDAESPTPELTPVLAQRGNKQRWIADQKSRLGWKT